MRARLVSFSSLVASVSVATLPSLSCSQTQRTSGLSTTANPKSNGPQEPGLREELLAMMAKDQELRKAMTGAEFSDIALIEELSEVDRRHTARLKEIISRHGFPGRSVVGDDGARAAWLLVQHADHDVAFQRESLSRMTILAERDEVSKSDLAYLTDRVLVNEGKSQRYGTQFHTIDGKLTPRPMEDPERVDQLRKSMGLSTMKEYTELMHT